MIGAKWTDLIVGCDIHWVLVPSPAGPVPTPLPHPFVGIIFDPIGLAVGTAISVGVAAVMGGPIPGPVLINKLPAANTGTEGTNKFTMPHIPMPPGTGWAPVPAGLKPPIPGKALDPGVPGPVPSNDGIIITGSKTVHISGTNASRLGDLVMTCGEPVRLPSSTIIAVPRGAPVLIGGPPALDFMAAALSAIRTSWISDRLRGAVNRVFGEGSRAARWMNRAVCFLTGHPVDTATGTVLTGHVDLTLPGLIPLELERNYSSAFAERDGPLGRGWSSSLHQAIAPGPKDIILRTEDGREVSFNVQDLPHGALRPGQEVWQPVERLTLRRRGEDEWEVESSDGLVREFTRLPGRDPTSRPTSAWVPLRRIRTSERSYALTFHYDRDGRLATVQDAAGRRVDLEHDRSGRVARVMVPTSDGLATRIHREFTYDNAGHLVAVSDSNGASWTFEYVNGLLVRETDRAGFSFYFAYDGDAEGARCLRTWGDGGAFDRTFQYDVANGRTFVTDSAGNVTIYVLNAQSLVTEIVEANGAAATIEWDEACRRIRETDPNGLSTSLEYSDDGRLVRMTTADGFSTEIGVPPRQDPRRTGDLLLAATGHSADLTPGHDALGWRTVRTDHAGQLVEMVSDLGEWYRLDRDALGTLTGVKSASGDVEDRRYDSEGRLVEVRTGTAALWDATYDAEGRLSEVRAGSMVTRLDYWCLDHVETMVVGDREIHYEHDLEGCIVRRTDSAGRSWRFAYDFRGDVTEVTFPDGSSESYQRDAGGRVTAARLRDGSMRRHEYDDGGRLLTVTYPDGETHEFRYDDRGALIEARTPSSIVRFERDARGRIVREEQDGVWIENAYDARGFRQDMRSSFGVHVTFERGAGGMLLGMTGTFEDRRVWRARFDRDPVRAEQRWTLNGDVQIHWIRAPSGRLEERRVLLGGRPLRVERLEWSWQGELLKVLEGDGAISGGDDGSRGFNRLERHGIEQLRRMDGFGNVFASADGGPEIDDDREYAATGALMRRGACEYEYDDLGRLVSKVARDEETVQIWSYEWYACGWLKAVTLPDSRRIEFGYDAFGRRLWRREGRVLTRWLWSGDVIVHEWTEEEASGSELTVATTWLSHPDLPLVLASLDRTGKAVTVVTDVRGNPTLGINASGAQVWRRDVDLWGTALREDGDASACPFRAPGQMEDRSTGLFYNRFRYYDPEAGLFISPDPRLEISHRSPYAYVRNVLWSIDPLGLIHEAQAWVVDENGKPVKDAKGNPVTVEVERSPHHDPTRSMDDPYSHRYNSDRGHAGHSEPSILRSAQADDRVMAALSQPGTRLRIVSQGSGTDVGTRAARTHRPPRNSCSSCASALQDFADDVGNHLGRNGEVIVEYYGESLDKSRKYTCS